MKLFLSALLLVLPLFAQERRITPVTLERKQALIIGNSTYPKAPLKNPANDAAAMNETLRGLGFEVTMLENLDLRHMEQAINRFTMGLSHGSLALFYFSGHGVQVDSINYLLPVDFAADSEADVPYDAYSASRIQDKMKESGANIRILILDACRNNPFRYKRSLGGGLARMTAETEGTLIAFATGDNNTADDNQAEGNGLYTKYLIPALKTPGLEIHEMFQKVRADVYRASNSKQNPAIYEDIVGDYYLTSPLAAPRTTTTTPPAKIDAAAEAWELIKNSQSPEDFESFARAFPSSDLARAASLRAEQLRRGATVVTARVDAPKTPPQQPQAPEKSGKVNSKDGLTYMWIPPGHFVMGCSPGAQCFDDNKPPHEVTLSKGFWMGESEVTQLAYTRLAGSNPSQFVGLQRPVENIAWNQAKTFCEEVGGRLPTEAEWEYAARAGTTGEQYGPLDAISWHLENSGGETHNIMQKQPNAWGLYDMLGNVWEWVSDLWSPRYSADHVIDPKGPPAGQGRIMRGGSYAYRVWGSSASSRYMVGPPPHGGAIGFRCVLDSL